MKLYQIHLWPYQKSMTPIIKWRYEELWTIQVNDLLAVNKRGLNKLYKLICSTSFKHYKNKVLTHNSSLASIDQVR